MRLPHAMIALPLLMAASVGTSSSDLSEEQLDLIAYQAMQDNDLVLARATFKEILFRAQGDAFAHMWLGQIDVQLNDLESAEQHFAAAVETVEARMASSDAAEAFAIRAKKAQMRLSLKRVRERRASFTSQQGGSLRVAHIPRVHWRQLGHSRFAHEFSIPRKPVIIIGFEDGITQPYCSMQHLRELCGHLRAPLRRHATDATSWGGLIDVGSQMTFAQHLDSLERGDAGDAFVFDWPLRTASGCQALLDELHVPSYFTGRTIHAYGPSLFAQGNGTKCGLHVDARATHFWQYVQEGRKRWRIFAPKDWPRLFEATAWRRAFFRDPRCSGAFGSAAVEAAGCEDEFGGAAVDAFDDEALGLLSSNGGELLVHEATLAPGELLFVPAGSPHQVQNIGVAIAVSMNFVDSTNAEEALALRLAEPELHATFRSRLVKGGKIVPGSQTRWFERFRMPWESHVEKNLAAVTALTSQEASRPDAAFLEPWSSFASRWWNRNLTSPERDDSRGQEPARTAVSVAAATGGTASVACQDTGMGFGGQLISQLGFPDETCAIVVPAFAEANGVSVPTICTVPLADIAGGLAESGIEWALTDHGAVINDLCCQTCSPTA